MITDVFLFIIGFFLNLLGLVLSGFSFIIPNGFENAIIYFLGHLNYVSGFLDINTLFQVIGVYLVFLGTLQLFHIIRWVWGMMPWVGKSVKLPSLGRDKK